MAIEISTIQQLIAFGNGDYGRGTSQEPIEVRLTADLDFAAYDSTYNWSGCRGTYYMTFDGQNHTVDNIRFSGTGTWGFFETIGINSIIKNLKLTNMNIVGDNKVCGLITYLYSNCKVINCHLTGIIQNINTSSYYQDNTNCVAGLVAYPQSNSYSYIIDCSFVGTLSRAFSEGHTHGISGHGTNNNSYLMVSNCYLDIKTNDDYYLLPVCYGVHGYIVNCEFRLHSNYNTFGAMINCIFIPDEPTYIGTDKAIYIDLAENNINSYVDGELAATNGYTTLTNITQATTAQLKSASWLRDRGFAV